jgi:hypothetical protein
MRLNKWLSTLFNPTDMSRKSDNEIIFYATSTGRTFVKADEFLRTTRVQNMIRKFMDSRLYKEIKEKESKAAARR